MRKLIPLLFFYFSSATAISQDNYDVLHYKYELEISDRSDTIYGKAAITIKLLAEATRVTFDLELLNDKGKGMQVGAVTGPKVKGLEREDEKITIGFTALNAGDTAVLVIPYHGVPSDGLIISKNRFGKRTFFADNWPNRAHHWLPCKDDPADKASVEFLVTAPNHYQVVSNGIMLEETNLPDNKKLTHWKEVLPLPTKVIVIGAAEFAVNVSGEVNCIPVTSWIYPEEKEKGLYDYAMAVPILSFFINYIGPYPFKKLANVQSKTIFGGMENASAIFYSEGSVTGTRESEGLIAHEIVHQWFGNTVTEKHFAHLWLSEGFATYLTHVYMENKYGKERFNTGLKEDRQQVINFARSNTNPVVDFASPLMQLLNANSYQKGSWILHMLRRQLGDAVFKKIIRDYFEKYQGKNADTRDFQDISEQVSKKDLDKFFDQWLYKPGVPKLSITWKYEASKKQLAMTVMQQPGAFEFPLELGIREANGSTRLINLKISKATETFRVSLKGKPTSLIADPNVSLLAETNVREEK